jgi:hypothetical protein
VNIWYETSKALTIGLFLFYGVSVLASDAMLAEFERFGLARFRRLTGALEVLGAAGLLAGYWLPWATGAAAAGLALLMVLGVATRVRVRDPILASVPALVLLAMTLYILRVALGA